MASNSSPWKIAFFLFFIVAYFSGFFVFLIVYNNKLAAGGYMGAAVQMSLRLIISCLSTKTLYKVFPLKSVRRALYQSFFLLVGIAFLILGFWCLAKGAEKSQSFSGSSYYCSMVGVWCAAKRGFFLTAPIYHLRPDKTGPKEYLQKMCLAMKEESRNSALHQQWKSKQNVVADGLSVLRAVNYISQ